MNQTRASARIRRCTGSPTTPTARSRRGGSKISREPGRNWRASTRRQAWRSWRKAGSSAARCCSDRTIESVEKNIQSDKTPPYIGLFPGTTLTFRESLEKERPSPQQWPHRPYAELLQADVLPPRLANQVVDCMRAYGATTLGVVANVWRFQEDGREILGFISYGYAQMLLRLDRIEEFLLFLYSHRYHAHTRGSWTAGEVTGITGDSGTYCVPAQQTIPLLVRWMLVLEDSDEEKLYLAKGVPREWVASGKEIRIEQAPTRWGKVSFSLSAKPERQVDRWARGVERSKSAQGSTFQVAASLQACSAERDCEWASPRLWEDFTRTRSSLPTRNEKMFEVVGQLRLTRLRARCSLLPRVAPFGSTRYRQTRCRQTMKKLLLIALALGYVARRRARPIPRVAATPPMGWNSWNHFACKVTAADVRSAADAIASNGMKDAGYVYVNIDDCWEGVRDEKGRIQPNQKFGDMKALVDYVHEQRAEDRHLFFSRSQDLCGIRRQLRA